MKQNKKTFHFKLLDVLVDIDIPDNTYSNEILSIVFPLNENYFIRSNKIPKLHNRII